MGVPQGTILAFDTSAAHCAAVLVAEGSLRLARTEAMQRGQAERLMPLLQELLAEGGMAFQDLDALAVGIGPGNFTGVRIAVAAARGLALALGKPLIGISSFELMIDPATPAAGPAHLLSLPAPRDQAYVQPFRQGIAQAAPRMIDPSAPPLDLDLGPDMVVRGHAAQAIAAPFHARAETADIPDFADRLGQRAAWRLTQPHDGRRPAPLYVRPADAAPPSDPSPVILDA